MNKTANTLRQLFDRLYQEQQRSWFPRRRGTNPSRQAQQLWNQLIARLPPIQEKDLERLFPTSSGHLHVDFSECSKVLYLPPLEKNAEFVPVLSMKCDVDGTRTEVKLEVMLYRQIQDQGPDGAMTPIGIGFRLESPHRDEEDENQQRESRHDFHHAQIIQRLSWGPELPSQIWLPCTQPSFPLTADSPVTLVVALLLTLYGKRRCWEFVSEDTRLLGWLKPYLMNTLQPWIKWRGLSASAQRAQNGSS